MFGATVLPVLVNAFSWKHNRCALLVINITNTIFYLFCRNRCREKASSWPGISRLCWPLPACSLSRLSLPVWLVHLRAFNHTNRRWRAPWIEIGMTKHIQETLYRHVVWKRYSRTAKRRCYDSVYDTLKPPNNKTAHLNPSNCQDASYSWFSTGHSRARCEK